MDCISPLPQYWKEEMCFAQKTYKRLTPRSKVLLLKLIVLQPAKKYPLILGKSKVHYHVHKAHHFPILSHMNPVHGLPSHPFMIRFNIILPPKSRSFKSIFPSGLPTKTLYAFLLSRIELYKPNVSTFLNSSLESYLVSTNKNLSVI